MNTYTSSQKYLSIDLTKKCPHNCVFCVVSGTRSLTEDQKIEDIEQFLIKYKAEGHTTVNLHGGEPSLYSEFHKLLKLINEIGYKEIIIQTNGWKLKDEKFIDLLIVHNVKLLVVSFHDCDQENNDYLTQRKDSFQEVTNGLKNAIKKGIDVRTNTVLLKSNYRRIKDILDYLYEIGVRTFNISSLNPWWIWVKNSKELFNELCPSYSELADYLTTAIESFKGKDVEITIEGFPYCVLPELNANNLYSSNRDITLLSENNYTLNYEEYATSSLRMKDEKCSQCYYTTTCGGVWRGYTEINGTEEFTPILSEN